MVQNVPVWCIIFVISHMCNSFVIQIEDGGYKNILVAIHNNVVEDKKLLENLKGLLANTSSFLYYATKGLAYFREITIAIPQNWSSQLTSKIISSNLFEQAHIRIDLENEYYGPEPFTRHFRDCGQQGEFIQLTPNYLQSLSSSTARNAFGIPERRLTHEWACFRYGVFKEHEIPEENYPNYYKEGNKVVPNTCSKKIAEASNFELHDGTNCDPSNGDVNCLLKFYGSSVDASASLMFSFSIPSVNTFCDDSKERQHNRRAINKHNIKCQYKSTWEVISNNKDFQFKRNSTHHPNTVPIFTIVRQSSSPGISVLLLDISGSMRGQPIKLLHEAASRFISDQAPDNLTLGVVEFGTDAHIKRGLTTVNKHTRKILLDSLPTEANGGGTAIGKGLEKALQVLETNKNNIIEGSVIMLITDGEETDKPFINEIIPKLVDKKVVVKSIAFGPGATEKLTNLTTSTGGQGFFFQSIDNASSHTHDLDTAFMEALTLQSDIAFEPVLISSSSLNMYLDESTFTPTIDEELGRNTIFTITSAHINSIAVELKSPSNRLYTHQSSEYSKNEGFKRITFHFKISEVGKWSVRIKRIGNRSIIISFSTKSEPKDAKKQPVRIKSFLNAVSIRQPATIKVFAMVTKNNLPVIGANVSATIVTPKHKTHVVKLKDNGRSADSQKNDGLYTGFFTNFDGKGRYSVSAEVVGMGKVRIRRKKIKTSRATPERHRRSVSNFTTDLEMPTVDDFYDCEDDNNNIYEEKPIGDFQRAINVGEFTMEDWAEHVGDIIPPVRVSDLEVVSVAVMSHSNRTVTLQWTSPGDDETYGNASYIDLRASTDFDQLLTNFTATSKINSSYVVKGTLKPQPANEIQTVVISFPKNIFHAEGKNKTNNEFVNIIYLSLRASDESGNVGDLSNIVTAYFPDVLNKASHNTEKDSQEDGLHPGIIIILVVICGAILLTILILTLRQRKKRNYRPVVLA